MGNGFSAAIAASAPRMAMPTLSRARKRRSDLLRRAEAAGGLPAEGPCPWSWPPPSTTWLGPALAGKDRELLATWCSLRLRAVAGRQRRGAPPRPPPPRPPAQPPRAGGGPGLV